MTNTVAGIVIPAGGDQFRPIDAGSGSDLAVMAQSMGNLADQTKADAQTVTDAATAAANAATAAANTATSTAADAVTTAQTAQDQAAASASSAASAQSAAASSAADAATARDMAESAQAAAYSVPDASVNAILSNPATDARTTLDGAYAAISRTAKRAVGQDELTLNVYDYGATDSTSTSSQTALDACYAAAKTIAAAGSAVSITIPRGSVVGDLVIDTPLISVRGPGNLVGSIDFVNPTTNGFGLRFYAQVTNLTITATTRKLYGIRFLGAAMVEVAGCTFQGTAKGILLDYWTTYTGTHTQQNKTINVHHCVFVNVNYALYGQQKDTGSWDTHADCKFTHNVVRIAIITAVYVSGADGFDVDDNVMFAWGFADANNAGGQKQLKQDSVYFGPSSNWINIRGNKIFEAGWSAIHTYRCQAVNIAGNHVAWYGQMKKSPGVLIETWSGSGFANPVTVTGNLIDEGYGHGIALGGDGDISSITVSDSNQVRLIGSTSRNVYYGATYGGAAQDVSDIARVYVGQSNLQNWPRAALTGPLPASRGGALSMRGIYCMSWTRNGEGDTRSSFQLTKTVTASTAVQLGSFFGSHNGVGARGDNYAGRVRVIVRSYGSALTNVPRLAMYAFDVDGTAKTVTNLTSNGLTAASADGLNPAFVFTLDATTRVLKATPQGATAGSNFVFTVTAEGFIQASMLAADFQALPMLATLAAAQTN